MPAYRDDLEALSMRQAALATEVATKTRELTAASELLADAKARARLPILDNIRVATPCSAEWAKMTGDARMRACGDCKKNVYNLSEMTRDEAQALIIEKEGKLCVRYFQRTDGTILLKDCVIGVSRKRRRRLVAIGAAALLAGGAGALYSSMTQRTMGMMSVEHETENEMLGQMVAPPEAIHETKGEMVAPPDEELIDTLGGVATPELYEPPVHKARQK